MSFKEILLQALEQMLKKIKTTSMLNKYFELVNVKFKNSMDENRLILLRMFENQSCKEIIDMIKISNMRKFKVEVKNLLQCSTIDIIEMLESGICLTIQEFFNQYPFLEKKFCNSCDLILDKGVVKSKNCSQKEIQGLYILTIGKDDKDYIVKLGSYAETQGMYKRLCSFGGGCYETGSATNKWFQQFMKKILESGLTAKFTFHDFVQNPVKLIDLVGNEKEIIPYVVRDLESQLFELYSEKNRSIPPIFGSNYKK